MTLTFQTNSPSEFANSDGGAHLISRSASSLAPYVEHLYGEFCYVQLTYYSMF